MRKILNYAAIGSSLAANWWIFVAAAVLCAVLFGAAQIQSCNGKKFQKETDKQKSDINQTKGEVIQIEEQKIEQQKQVNIANAASSAAGNNVNAVTSVDSSARNSSREAAIREWCKDHPSDSKCKR